MVMYVSQDDRGAFLPDLVGDVQEDDWQCDQTAKREVDVEASKSCQSTLLVAREGDL